MITLRKKVVELVAELNTDWIQAIKAAEKEGEGLDLTELLQRYTLRMQDLDNAFLDFEDRKNPVKKKRW